MLGSNRLVASVNACAISRLTNEDISSIVVNNTRLVNASSHLTPGCSEAIMNRIVLRMIVLLNIVAVPVAPCRAQESATKDEAATKKAVTEHWLGVADKLAKDYTFSPASATGSPFPLHDKAVFRHTQTVRGDDIGSVYLWKEASGRPAVVGVIFGWSQGRIRNVMHEFHSLHKQGIAMDLPGRKSWSTDQPGLEWLPFPKADAPDASPLKRKLQAKALSRRVSANATDPTRSRWELRLVPTPIYEYAVADEGVDYGGVFSLCQGTDTELLVMVEARKTGDKSEWYYAFAPFTDYQLAVSIDDKEMWKSQDGTMAEDGKPHYWDFVDQQPKPDFEP